MDQSPKCVNKERHNLFASTQLTLQIPSTLQPWASACQIWRHGLYKIKSRTTGQVISVKSVQIPTP
jgi:hypothetical protein